VPEMSEAHLRETLLLLRRNGIRSIEQNTTFTTDPLSGGLVVASSTVLGVDVPAAGRGVLLQQTDVAFFTEGSGPRIANDPVSRVQSKVKTIPDFLDHVVDSEVFGVVATVVDTTFVIVPVGGVDVDSEGTSVDEGVDDGGLVVGGDSLVTRELGNLGCLFGNLAFTSCTVVSCVRIFPFLSDTAIFDDVLVGELSDGSATPTSASALVGVGGASGNLLLRQNKEFTGDDSVVGLKSFSRSVGPATSAHALIFDGSEHISASPVQGLGENLIGILSLVNGEVGLAFELLFGTGVGGELGAVEALLFSGSPIRHVIQTLAIQLARLGVVHHDFLELSIEELFTLGVFDGVSGSLLVSVSKVLTVGVGRSKLVRLGDDGFGEENSEGRNDDNNESKNSGELEHFCFCGM